MALFFVVAVLLGVILIFIRYSLWREKYCQNIPGIKPGFFNVPGDLTNILTRAIFNDNHSVLYHLAEFLKERNEQLQKQLFYIWFSYKPHVCIVKADAVKDLLSKAAARTEKSWHYEYFRVLLGTGLITSPVDKWKPRRKLLTPCFHSDILRGFLTTFNERSRALVEYLRQETKKEFSCIGTPVTLTALDIIYETMLGTSIGALENNGAQYMNAIQKLLHLEMARLVKFWEWTDFLFDFTSGREVKRLVKFLQDVTKSVIQEKKKQYLKGNKNDTGKRKAFMDLLLELHLETKELSEEDITEEVNTFVTAGHETIATTITWALYFIGLYPDVQAKVHEELDAIFGDDVNTDVTENDLKYMKYLDCVLKETNRLYSVVPLIGRDLKEDANICGYTIPKNSTCIVLIYFLHRDKDVFPDPEKFDPDRFLPENFAKIPDYGYIPFSAGPRNCIGKNFANMEMKTIVSSILRNFTIESLDSRDKVLPIMEITLHPSIPIRMRIKPRRMHKIE